MIFMNTKVDWPLDKNMIRRSSENNTFGMVRTNTDGTPRPHQGWDFYAIPGTFIYSVSEGKVIFAGDAGALGNLLVVSIGLTNKYAAYAHLSNIKVPVGAYVKLGQHIAYTGSSGNAENMRGEDQHLHFEVRDKPLTGLGLSDRISPLQVFGKIPYQEIKRELA